MTQCLHPTLLDLSTSKVVAMALYIALVPTCITKVRILQHSHTLYRAEYIDFCRIQSKGYWCHIALQSIAMHPWVLTYITSFPGPRGLGTRLIRTLYHVDCCGTSLEGNGTILQYHILQYGNRYLDFVELYLRITVPYCSTAYCNMAT